MVSWSLSAEDRPKPEGLETLLEVTNEARQEPPPRFRRRHRRGRRGSGRRPSLAEGRSGRIRSRLHRLTAQASSTSPAPTPACASRAVSALSTPSASVYSDFQDAYGTRARGRLNVDVRTQTAYGTLRTFIRYELTNNTGIYRLPAPVRSTYGSNVPGLSRGPASSATTSLLDLAFVQFGPITAGRAQSFFDFYASDLNFASIRTADSRVNLLAYTATFGSGFSATMSLEDRTSGTVGRELGGIHPDPVLFVNGGAAVTQGQDYPDLIASLRVDQGWGSAQLSGAVGQRNYATVCERRRPCSLSMVTNLPGPSRAASRSTCRRSPLAMPCAAGRLCGRRSRLPRLVRWQLRRRPSRPPEPG